MPRNLKLYPNSAPNWKPAAVATEDEVLEFCNKVRAAGQADALEALLPSRPGNENSCLIANALNFSSSVLPIGEPNDETGYTDTWIMRFPKEVSIAKRKAIAAATGCDLKTVTDEGERYTNVLILPETIGHAADAFDAQRAFKKYIKVIA